MTIGCPSCQARIKVPDSLLGRTGRCPRCGGAVPVVPIAEEAGVVAPSPQVMAAEPEPALAVAASPASCFADEGVPLVEPVDDDQAYDLGEASDLAPPPMPRPGADGPAPPKKSKRQRARELEDLRSEGNRYLLKIRLLLLGLGLLMIVFNAYTFTTVDETVTQLKSDIQANPGRGFDPAKLEALAWNVGLMMKIECVMYLVLGVALCVLAAIIRIAPLVATIAALGTYVGAWILDLLIIEAIFGGFVVGLAVFNLGTVVKAAIISGLWYGVQVGQAYQEQIVKPERELMAEDMG